MRTIINLALIIFTFTLLGCGSDGGGSAPTTAVIKITASEAAPGNTSLSGIGVTLTLPTGVTVKTNTDGSVASGVVTPSGVALTNSEVVTTYTAATATTAGKLVITVASTTAGGFKAGEFVTVTTDIAVGAATPKPADFTLSDLKPADLSKIAAVAGITASLTADIK